MKIGDYVRTEYGIAKIKEFETKNKEVINLDKDIMICNMDCFRNCCTINQVIKSSPNIIDLIEVGDYIDGYPVAKIYKSVNKDIGRVIEYETDNVGGYEYEAENLWESHIKSISIVTKEQFKSMEYKYDR